jgi:hypothetical protein
MEKRFRRQNAMLFLPLILHSHITTDTAGKTKQGATSHSIGKKKENISYIAGNAGNQQAPARHC